MRQLEIHDSPCCNSCNCYWYNDLLEQAAVDGFASSHTCMPALKTFEDLGIGFRRPKVTKTLIREYHLGQEVIDRLHKLGVEVKTASSSVDEDTADKIFAHTLSRAGLPGHLDPASQQNVL